MRYPSQHKRETREQLLRASRRIAKRDGFGGTGVDALMAAIGRSGGAFYGHFGSKAELFAELVEREMAHSARMLSADALARCLRAYLSMDHVSHPEAGCVLPALGAEIGRADAKVRRRVERALAELERAWRAQLGEHGDAAWALIAQCVGTLVIARATASDSVRRAILASSRGVALAQLPTESATPEPRATRPRAAAGTRSPARRRTARGSRSPARAPRSR